jgi:glycosyltransferase involved in cell wall biosynthesis
MAISGINQLSVIIPTLDPEEKLLKIADSLHDAGFAELIIVDDGSNKSCEKVFQALEERSWCRLLRHPHNKGKGAALKTAFMDYLSRHPEGPGAITTDDDGQHTISDIVNVAEKFCAEPDALHLGCRNFNGDDVPWKSKIGNNLTRSIFRLFAGVSIADTQTGLRAIPAEVMELSLAIRGNRFEFETAMLLRAWDKNVKFCETTIETVYLDGNSGTHFHPIKDAARIYRVIFAHLLRQLFRFMLSSMSSALVDFLLFSFLVRSFALEKDNMALPLLTACGAARFVSAAWNFTVNRYWVFATDTARRSSLRKSLSQYVTLCIAIFSASYGLTYFLGQFVEKNTLPYWKLLIDLMLFLLSFMIQKISVFRKKND